MCHLQMSQATAAGLITTVGLPAQASFLTGSPYKVASPALITGEIS